jgi:hypothetical protein
MTITELMAELPETTFTFLNQPAKISKRSKIKPGQSYLFAYFPNKEKPFRAISSLYLTPYPDKLSLEYKKAYYVLSVPDMKVLPDPSKQFWKSSKTISQELPA